MKKKDKPSKPSEALDKALTRQADAEAGLNETVGQIRAVELDRFKDKARFEKATDFDQGYFLFNGEVDDCNVTQFGVMLRTFNRIYPGKSITIEMNSPGGSIVDGFQLFDELLRLRGLGHHVTIRIRGMAASMAGVLLQSADQREVGPNAFIMIHRAAFATWGKAFQVEDELEAVKKMESRIIDIFAERSGRKRKVYEDMFAKRKDLWFTAKEAVEAGLADAIR